MQVRLLYVVRDLVVAIAVLGGAGYFVGAVLNTQDPTTVALVLLLGGGSVAHAGTAFCRDYPVVNGFYVIDGNDPALTPATLPSSISIDSTVGASRPSTRSIFT